MKVIVVGGGQVGSHIAKLLLEAGCGVKVLEPQKKALGKLQKELPPEVLVIGSGTDSAVLEAAGIADADVFVAVTGADEINLVASTVAKFEFGVKRVIARVNNPKNDWLFSASNGVDVKFSQADILAHLVVDEIDIHNMVTLMKLNRGVYSIVQLSVEEGSLAAGKQVQELSLSQEIVFIAVHRGNDVVLPRGNVELKPGDRILMLADEPGQQEVNRLFSAR